MFAEAYIIKRVYKDKKNASFQRKNVPKDKLYPTPPPRLHIPRACNRLDSTFFSEKY